MDDRDLADGNAEALSDELAERGFVTLAVAVRSGEDLDGADRVDPHLRGFPQADAAPYAPARLRRRDPAGFYLARHADAAQLAFRLRLGLASGEAGIVDCLHCGVERGIKVADVIGHDHGRLV